MKGELIGVVNSKSSGTDIEGLGFAIPINTAKKVMSDIIESGYVKGRVETGLSVVEILDAQTAWMYRVEYAGLYISESTNTQFESGDRIIAIGNVEIASESDYNEALTNYSVGDTVQITVSRGYDTLTIPLLLAEMGV
jgi:serine protease Do